MILLLTLACRTELDRDGDGWTVEEDCNDLAAGIHPGAEELCDGLDQDCDGEVDEEAIDPSWFVQDEDGDGFGGAEELACSGPELSEKRPDCDDQDASVHPGATELCNALDDDCDGLVDDEDPDLFEAPSWYADWDEDGYGDASASTEACERPEGLVEDGTDCDDYAPETHPGAEEVPYDGVDQDCDGSDLDDVDGDGSPWPEDCDDEDPTRGHDLWEVCDDGVDNDCDDEVDTDCQYFGGGEVSGDPLVTIYGDEESGDCCGSSAGMALLGGQDLNGDGQADLAFWSQGDPSELVHVVFGPVSGEELWAEDSDGRIELDWSGGQVGLVSWDHNADGIASLLVADPGVPSLRLFEEPAGAHGTADASMTIFGAEQQDSTGRRLASLDPNGDGLVDLVVSTPERWSWTEEWERWTTGEVSILPSGTSESGELQELSVATFSQVDGRRGHLGEPLAVGDFDGDGREDLVVGDLLPLDEAGLSTNPMLYVFGGPGAGHYTTADADAALTWVAEAHRYYSHDLSSSDLAGDGRAELVVTTQDEDGPVIAVLADPLAMSSTSSSVAVLESAEVDSRPWSTELLDLDSDGFQDFLIGMPGAGGEEDEDYGPRMVYAVFGPVSGSVIIEEEAEGWLTGSHAPFELCETDGCEHPGSYFGYRVADGGDLNGDGQPDFLVSAPWFEHDLSSNKKGPGAVYLYEGGPRPD